MYAYDIAIIKLYVSITFSEKVRPICFPKKRTKDHNLTVWSAGWGLRYAELKDNPDTFYNATNPESSCITNEVGPETFKAWYIMDSKILAYLALDHLITGLDRNQVYAACWSTHMPHKPV